MPQKIRLLLVDDHEIVRLGLKSLFGNEPDMEVIGEAGEARESIELARRLAPDIVIMDVRLPDASGIEACRIIRSDNPAVKVIILTSYADREAMLAAIMAGAEGYVLKKIWGQDLVAAVRSVSRGQSLLDREAVRQALEEVETFTNQHRSLEKLTSQEKKILALIGEAKTNREIAAALCLSEKTVRNYVSNLLRKLNLANRAQAAVYATRLSSLTKE